MVHNFAMVFANNVLFDKAIYLQMLLEIIYVVLFVMICKSEIKQDLSKFNKSMFFKAVIYYILMYFSSFVINVALMLVTDRGNSVNQQSIEMMAKINPVYIIFATVIFAPIVEEIVFRLCIYKWARKRNNIVVSQIITAVLFATMHFVIAFLTRDFGDLVFIFVYMVPSFFLCHIYEETQNIIAPITVHFINNLIAISLTFVV